MELISYTNQTFSATDLAGILGARLNRTCSLNVDYKKVIQEQKVSLFNSPYDNDDDLCAMEIKNPDGSRAYVLNTSKNLGLAPVLSLSVLPKDLKQLLTDKKEQLKSGLTLSFGEYPQWVADEKTAEELNKIEKLYPTGKTYTFNTIVSPYYEERNRHHNAGCVYSDQHHRWRLDVSAQLCYENRPEVMYHGEKYVCVTARYVLDHDLPNYWKTRVDNKRISIGHEFILSNGSLVGWGKPYWVKVGEVEWKTDEFVLIPSKVLLGGIPLGAHYDWTTKYTDEFVEKYFYKDILPSDAREVAKIQFKDEVRESINIKNAQDTKELSSCVRRALKPYLNVKTKEALYVVGYASWLFDMIQKGNLNQDTIQEELKTPCLKKKPNGCLFFFKDIFSSSKVRY